MSCLFFLLITVAQICYWVSKAPTNFRMVLIYFCDKCKFQVVLLFWAPEKSKGFLAVGLINLLYV